MSAVPDFSFNELPGNTIVPSLKEEMTFIQYFNRLYEDIAFAVNNKENIFFTIPISSNPVNIPNVPNFGAFLLAISGTTNQQPAAVYALAKADMNIAGNASNIVQNDGTGAWAGSGILITSTATNYQIRHDNAGVIGNFNLRIVSSQ